MSTSRPHARLMIASTESDADMFYATRFFVPDPFIFIQIKNKSYAIMSDLEVDRARAEAKVSEVHSYSDWARKAAATSHSGKPVGLLDVVEHFLRTKRVRSLTVPHHFPTGYADRLRRRGIRLAVGETPFYTERLIKSAGEIRAIENAQRHTEASMRAAIEVISKSRIRGRFLYRGSKKLTSEYVRRVIHEVLLGRDCVGRHTIVASGEQACDPHQTGSGPLYAHRAIILDIFPRSAKTNYFADMTRTVCRGKASPKLKHLYQTVKRGQDLGMSMIRDGVTARSIHRAITDYFAGLGYATGLYKGRMQGFFHGTGHGVGLDIHEPPRVGASNDRLRKGMVVTVEPGLYYPGLGGVRLENIVVVGKRNGLSLTRFPRVFEI